MKPKDFFKGRQLKLDAASNIPELPVWNKNTILIAVNNILGKKLCIARWKNKHYLFINEITGGYLMWYPIIRPQIYPQLKIWREDQHSNRHINIFVDEEKMKNILAFETIKAL